MRIVQYLPYSFTIHAGGLEKIAQTISHGLANQFGHEVTDVSSDISKGISREVPLGHPIDIYIPSFDLVGGFPFPKIWSKAFWSNISQIKSQKPDIIITHTRFFLQSMVGGLIAKYTGAKRVHVEHGSGFVTGYPRYIKTPAYIFDWTIGLRIFRQCNQIITISNIHRAFIYKFTSKNPIVIYNPIDFHPKPKTQNDIVHIGFVGRLVSLKGVDVLIQALSNLDNKNRKCIIVGAGAQDEYLRNLVIEKGLAGHEAAGLSDSAALCGAGYITFVGSDDRINRLHKFDIFVNPSHQEGLPTTVVEALLAKCIVVATDVGGTVEISDQDDLIIVKQGNPADLQKGIQLAMNRLDQSGKSHDIVTQKFGPEKVIKQYEKVLQNIIK